MQVEITTRCKIHHKSKFHYFATSFLLCVQECVPGRCWTHFAAEESDHLSLVSPGPFGDLEGFMLYAQTSSKKTLVERKWEIILWWVLLMRFQQCSCLHVPRMENSLYLQALSLGCSDRDNWPLDFMGKKRALSGKMLEKLIRMLNEQIFYCHFFSVPRERDNINCLSEKWWRIMTNGYMGDRMNIQIWKK